MKLLKLAARLDPAARLVKCSAAYWRFAAGACVSGLVGSTTQRVYKADVAPSCCVDQVVFPRSPSPR